MEKTVTMRFDDFDSTLPAVARVRLTLDGKSVDLDLAQAHLAELQDTLAPWFQAGRPVGKGRKQAQRSVTKKATPPRRNGESAKIRAWASDNGVAVPSRGMVPKSVVAQYRGRGTS